MALDTRLAAEVMIRCGRELKYPDYRQLARLIERVIDRMPDNSIEDITEQVIEVYRGGVDLE